MSDMQNCDCKCGCTLQVLGGTCSLCDLGRCEEARLSRERNAETTAREKAEADLQALTIKALNSDIEWGRIVRDEEERTARAVIELAALRAENEALKGERDEWHLKANAALQRSIDAERERDGV